MKNTPESLESIETPERKVLFEVVPEVAIAYISIHNGENNIMSLEVLGQLENCIAELKEKVLSTRKNLLELRMKRAEQKNPLKLRWLRRDIARMLTLINEKSTGGTVEKSN